VHGPFPSMPVGFWNDPDARGTARHYFERFTRRVAPRATRREIQRDGSALIHGRSGRHAQPGGVRIGTAEIYRALPRRAGGCSRPSRWASPVRRRRARRALRRVLAKGSQGGAPTWRSRNGSVAAIRAEDVAPATLPSEVHAVRRDPGGRFEREVGRAGRRRPSFRGGQVKNSGRATRTPRRSRLPDVSPREVADRSLRLAEQHGRTPATSSAAREGTAPRGPWGGPRASPGEVKGAHAAADHVRATRRLPAPLGFAAGQGTSRSLDRARGPGPSPRRAGHVEIRRSARPLPVLVPSHGRRAELQEWPPRKPAAFRPAPRRGARCALRRRARRPPAPASERRRNEKIEPLALAARTAEGSTRATRSTRSGFVERWRGAASSAAPSAEKRPAARPLRPQPARFVPRPRDAARGQGAAVKIVVGRDDGRGPARPACPRDGATGPAAMKNEAPVLWVVVAPVAGSVEAAFAK
jgi:hypothetical protein